MLFTSFLIFLSTLITTNSILSKRYSKTSHDCVCVFLWATWNAIYNLKSQLKLRYRKSEDNGGSNFIFSNPRDCWQSNNAAAKTNFTWSKKACIALFYQIQALQAKIEQSTSFKRLKIFYLLILDFSSDMPK